MPLFAGGDPYNSKKSCISWHDIMDIMPEYSFLLILAGRTCTYTANLWRTSILQHPVQALSVEGNLDRTEPLLISQLPA